MEKYAKPINEDSDESQIIGIIVAVFCIILTLGMYVFEVILLIFVIFVISTRFITKVFYVIKQYLLTV